MNIKGMEKTEVATHRCLNCGYIPHWGHLNDRGRYVPGSWSCSNFKCQKDSFWEITGFHYNNWYSKEYSDAYRAKYGDFEWEEGVSEIESLKEVR